MIHSIYEGLLNVGFSDGAVIFLLALLPISELRGAIPVGILLLKQPVLTTFIIAIAGNLFPVPFFLVLLDPLSRRLRQSRLFRRFFDWLYARTTKRALLVERYGALGLALFVGVPLPMTGAWTGCLAASIFRLRFRYAMVAIVAGVVIAGVIVTAVTLTGRWGFGLIVPHI